MIDFTSAQAVAIYAGFSVGGIVGAGIETRTEVSRREETQRPIEAYEVRSYSKIIKVILVVSLRCILLTVIVVAVGLFILRLGGQHGLDHATKQPFALALVSGAVSAKFTRYLYWRSK